MPGSCRGVTLRLGPGCSSAMRSRTLPSRDATESDVWTAWWDQIKDLVVWLSSRTLLWRAWPARSSCVILICITGSGGDILAETQPSAKGYTTFVTRWASSCPRIISLRIFIWFGFEWHSGAAVCSCFAWNFGLPGCMRWHARDSAIVCFNTADRLGYEICQMGRTSKRAAVNKLASIFNVDDALAKFVVYLDTFADHYISITIITSKRTEHPWLDDTCFAPTSW